MALITPAFYVLCGQGWGYLFARWWISLLLLGTLAFVDFLLVSGVSYAKEVWVYRFLPGLLAWAAGALLSQAIYRVNGVRFRDTTRGEFYPFAFFFEALFYTLLMLPIVGTHNTLNVVLVAVTGFIFLWIAHSFSKLQWRFSDDGTALAYYFLYWMPMLFVSLLVLLVGAILLDPTFQNNALHFWAALGSAGAAFLFILFTEAYMRQRQTKSVTPSV